MQEKDPIKPFVKPNKMAYSRYKKAKVKAAASFLFAKVKKAWGAVSGIILWVCAVGGFIIALLQFLKDHP